MKALPKDDHAPELSIWSASDGGWLTSPNTKQIVRVQPCRPRDEAAHLARAAGVKRIRYGYFVDIAIDADEFGRFTPRLAIA